MYRIKVHPDDLRRLAALARQTADIVSTNDNMIQASMSDLLAAWVGQSSDVFAQSANEIQAVSRQVLAALNHMSTNLDRIALALETADRETAVMARRNITVR